MKKSFVFSVALALTLAVSSFAQSSLQIGGASSNRDFGWGQVFTDWQSASPPATLSSLTSSPIDLGNGIEMILRLETASIWDVTTDNPGAGVRSGLAGDDDDRLDATEWLELSIFSISDPLNNLTSLTLSEITLGAFNNNPEGEQAEISDGTNSVTLTDSTGGIGTYGPSGNLSTLDQLNVGNIGTWRVRVTAIEDTAGSGSNIRFDQVNFEYSAVPEPSAFALIAGGLASLVILRRRR